MSVYRLSDRPDPLGAGRIAALVRSGEIGPDTLAAAPGSEDWFPASLIAAEVEAAQAAEQAEQAARQRPAPAKRRKTRPWRAFSWGLALLSLVLAFAVSWVLGLIGVVVAIAIDRPRWICGKCGGRIEPTATLCPGCGAPVAK